MDAALCVPLLADPTATVCPKAGVVEAATNVTNRRNSRRRMFNSAYRFVRLHLSEALT
jgi:hypothetical protein